MDARLFIRVEKCFVSAASHDVYFFVNNCKFAIQSKLTDLCM